MRYLFLSFFLLATASIGLAAEPDKMTTSSKKVLESQNGRYVFGQISELARHQFMLDTHTGRLWNLKEMEDGTEILTPIMYDLSVENLKAFSPPKN